MKNLRKLTKKNLKEINGGAGTVWCPSKPITSCGTWCGLTKEQKMRCLLDVEEPCECF
ncbi:bacteriocin-like protein [Chryseobacterium sp. 'Rf worker isolate 10']|uniref:bacteriocin-like protein n=1 Tax=Chryseobacterium sp. 'Rf worker isolate 10' TaxID=2887348 RepID=UPI003D6E84A4